MFNYYKRKLEKLVQSDRYKQSKYQIQIINGKYALNYKNTNYYVDLCSNSHKWSIEDRWFKDCIGTIRDVIKAFNYRVPIIEPIKIITTL